jgi:dihydroorotase
MTFTLYYEDGNVNIFDDNGTKVYDPMEDILTDITDSNIVLETITSQDTYLKSKSSDSTINKSVMALNGSYIAIYFGVN